MPRLLYRLAILALSPKLLADAQAFLIQPLCQLDVALLVGQRALVVQHLGNAGPIVHFFKGRLGPRQPGCGADILTLLAQQLADGSLAPCLSLSIACRLSQLRACS